MKGKKELLRLLIDTATRPRREDKELRAYKNLFIRTAISSVKKWEYDASKIQNAPFQVLDFFCGCGGMSAGFASVASLVPLFEIVGGCDINSDACAAFTENYEVPAIADDVVALATDSKKLGNFLSKLPNYNKTRQTIVIGCAPCQGFSSHRKKEWNTKDERNSLVESFARLAVKLNPVCVVMENVPELLGRKYWSHFVKAKDVFESAGFIVKAQIYNAAAFGVPQERFRAVVIAMKKDFEMFEGVLGEDEFLTVRDAIGSLPAVRAGQPHRHDSLHRSAGHKESTLETIRAIPKNGGSRPRGVGPKCLDKIKGFSDVYGRLFWDRPAITLTHYSRNPASGRFVHPEQDRGLTLREAALLQSFPSRYRFAGGFDAMFKQVGEAVPPCLAAAVASNVAIEILSPASRHARSEFHITKPVSSSYSSVIAGLKVSRRVA